MRNEIKSKKKEIKQNGLENAQHVMNGIAFLKKKFKKK